MSQCTATPDTAAGGAAGPSNVAKKAGRLWTAGQGSLRQVRRQAALSDPTVVACILLLPWGSMLPLHGELCRPFKSGAGAAPTRPPEHEELVDVDEGHPGVQVASLQAPA